MGALREKAHDKDDQSDKHSQNDQTDENRPERA
jgi:hypothetical protein